MTYPEHMARRRAVREQILTCNNCRLGVTANRVPFTGTSWAPKLILMGEAPGANEDQAGEPFVGRAGHLLEDMLKQVGLTRNHVLIANTVCCRPPGNRAPETAEVQACVPNREAQINLARTWVGVILGAVPLNALLGKHGEPIGAWKGRPLWYDSRVWVPTYHPAYALRNPKVVPEIVGHLHQALRLYEGKDDPPRPKTSGFIMERGCLIVDHEDVKVPAKIRELAKASFELTEWAQIRYLDEKTQDLIISLKTDLGATVIRTGRG